MAGLTIKELKFRGLVERTLIVTPANLTDQWRRELHDKFGETFSVINRATVSAAYGRNVWEDNPQCITSIDFLARQDDVLNLIRDIHWDLVIVDEAHKIAAYRYGQKVNKTQRLRIRRVPPRPHRPLPLPHGHAAQGRPRQLRPVAATARSRLRSGPVKRLGDLQKLGKLRQEYEELPDDLEDLTEEERWRFEDDVVERLTMAENMAELEAEIEELQRLVKLARQTEKNVAKPSSRNSAGWFPSTYRAVRAAAGLHRAQGLSRLPGQSAYESRLLLLYYPRRHAPGKTHRRRAGNLSTSRRHQVATEAAGEGILNLQFCSLMVNYAFPWNPNRLEQRMGRIHRYRQQHEAMIFNRQYPRGRGHAQAPGEAGGHAACLGQRPRLRRDRRNRCPRRSSIPS